MNIYTILSSKEHNSHNLNRYIKFIESLKYQKISEYEYTESHHICPKAKDMFPEYKCLKTHTWNKIILTARQHFIAHKMLWKIYKNSSQTLALKRMYFSKQNNGKISSKEFDTLKKEHRKIKSEFISNRHAEALKEGTHNWQGANNHVHQKVADGTHHWQGANNHVHQKVADGTHHWCGSQNNDLRVSNGTHPFLDKEKAKQRAQKRVKEGTSNFKDKVSVVDRSGNHTYIPRIQFLNQIDDEFVSIGSKKAYQRRNIDMPNRKKETKPRKTISREDRLKASERAKNREKLYCVVCGVTMDSSNFKKHKHGENCKKLRN